MKYEAICLGCCHIYDYFRPVAERNNIPPCPECQCEKVAKVIVTVQPGLVKGKFDPFKSQVDGSVITCERDLQEHNKRNNVALLGDGFSNEDILTGNFGQKGLQPPDKKEIAKDIVESIKRVESGYKPTIENEGAEL